MSSGEAITVKGEVVSVKPKYDRHDAEALGITVKPRGSSGAFWFRWTSSRGKITRGDIIEVEAIKTGESEPNEKGQTMTFLKSAKIKGTICTHLVLTKDGKKGYVCEGCGKTAKLTVEKGA